MNDMEGRIAAFISDKTGNPATVRDLTRIPGGFSYETWSLYAAWKDEGGQHDERVILRRAPRGGVLEPYDASREFRVLRALESSAVPAPRAFWGDASGDVLGTSFYLMEFVDGAIPLPWDPSLDESTKTAMHEAFTDMLADLHLVDWKAGNVEYLGVPADENDPAALELDRCREVLDRISLRPYPVLRDVIAWLDERRPRSPNLCLIHDDYRMGNFIWRDGRIVALLDWERAFLGDPMADIAFTRLKALAGWCTIDGAMARRYTEKSGIEVDENRVAYYETLEMLKATLVGLTGLKAFSDGRSSDLRLIQIGRYAHQNITGLASAMGEAK